MTPYQQYVLCGYEDGDSKGSTNEEFPTFDDPEDFQEWLANEGFK